MIGQPFDPDMVTDDLVAAAISPIGDMRANAAYRATGAAELLRRTIKTLASEQRALA